MPVTNVGFNPEIGALNIAEQSKPTAAPGFSDYFLKMLSDVNTKMHEAEEVSKAFASGETNNLHETMLAVEQANIAFRLVGTVRNRALEAYQEIMRMPI